jgi:hypothetical protein
LGKEHLVNNRLISTLDKVIYLKGRIFSKVYETSLHKIGWRPADKKIARSFNMCVLGRSKISMVTLSLVKSIPEARKKESCFIQQHLDKAVGYSEMKDKDFCQRIHISRVTRRVCK